MKNKPLDNNVILCYSVGMMKAQTNSVSNEILGQVSRGSLAQQVVLILKRLIIMEAMQEGDRLPPERDLAVMLDVSQRVVREALGQLAGEGLIVKKHGRGAFVQSFDRERLQSELVVPSTQFPSPTELHEARGALEIGAMHIAARHATSDDILALEKTLNSMEHSLRNQINVIAEDLLFHQTLLRATHNETLQNLGFIISESIPQNVYLQPGLLQRRLKDETHVLSAHRAIVDALREKDGEKASQAMYAHLRRTLEGWVETRQDCGRE